MKAITLWQPWATWCVMGWKTVDTRGHSNFRGLVGQVIAIHAGKQFDNGAFRKARGFMPPLVQRLAANEPIPHGAIVGMAKVHYARWLTPNDASLALCHTDTTRFGLFLVEPRKLDTPVACKGAQGIWEVPADVAAILLARQELPGGQFQDFA